MTESAREDAAADRRIARPSRGSAHGDEGRARRAARRAAGRPCRDRGDQQRSGRGPPRRARPWLRVATKAAIASPPRRSRPGARSPSERRWAASHAFQSRSRMKAGAMSCSAIHAVSAFMWPRRALRRPTIERHEAVAAREDQAALGAGRRGVGAVARRREAVQRGKRGLAEHRPHHRDLGGHVEPLPSARPPGLEVRARACRPPPGRPPGARPGRRPRARAAGRRRRRGASCRPSPGATISGPGSRRAGRSGRTGVIEVRTSAGFAAWSDSQPRPSAARWPGANDSSTTSARRARSEERGAGRRTWRDRAPRSGTLPRTPTSRGRPRPAPRRPPAAPRWRRGWPPGGSILQHVGAEVGEDLAAERAERAGEVDHAQVGEGAAAHRRARRAVSARSRAGSRGRSRPRRPARARGRAAPTPDRPG